MFEIKSVCCDCWHDSDFRISRENCYGCYVVIFFKTKAVITISNTEYPVEPNTVVIYHRSSRNDYRADGEPYCDDYLAFECSDRTMSSYKSIMDKPIFVGSAAGIDDYLHLICDAYYGGRSKSIHTNLINAMLEEILLINGKSEKQSSHFPALVELRKEIYSSPQLSWNVKLMSDKVMLSEPYLQELYKEAFGISPIADVINSRIATAKTFLADMSLSISEIAALCGYNSTVHFSRQFRKVTGKSPAEFRRS